MYICFSLHWWKHKKFSKWKDWRNILDIWPSYMWITAKQNTGGKSTWLWLWSEAPHVLSLVRMELGGKNSRTDSFLITPKSVCKILNIFLWKLYKSPLAIFYKSLSSSVFPQFIIDLPNSNHVLVFSLISILILFSYASKARGF